MRRVRQAHYTKIHLLWATVNQILGVMFSDIALEKNHFRRLHFYKFKRLLTRARRGRRFGYTTVSTVIWLLILWTFVSCNTLLLNSTLGICMVDIDGCVAYLPPKREYLQEFHKSSAWSHGYPGEWHTQGCATLPVQYRCTHTVCSLIPYSRILWHSLHMCPRCIS